MHADAVDGQRAVLAALRRNRDEAQLTQVTAAVAGLDPHFAGELARVLVAAAPNADNVQAISPVPRELECRPEERLWSSERADEGRVDLVFENQDEGFVLLVELKLHAGYGHEQVARYLRGRQRYTAERVGVLAVTRDAPAYGEPEQRTAGWLGSVRWARVLEDIRAIDHLDARARELWLTVLDICEQEGDLGVTELDVDAIHAWARYKRGRGQLEEFMREAATGAFEAVKDELAQASDLVPVGEPPRLLTRGAGEYRVWPYQESIHLRVALPGDGRERLRIQFLGGFSETLFTVEARHEDARRLPEPARSTVRELSDRMQATKRFDTDGKTYWARVHRPEQWLAEPDNVPATLVELTRTAVDELAGTGLLSAETGLCADSTDSVRARADELDEPPDEPR